jgi:hypothetical protein
VRSIRADDTQGKAVAEKMWFSIYFPTYGTDSQGEESFTIHRINPPKADQMPPKNIADGWKQYRSGALTTAFKQSIDKPVNAVRVDLPAARVGDKNYVLNIEFDHIPRLANVKELEILVGYQPATEAAGGGGVCNPANPVSWTIAFAVYDADKQGNPTEQISTDDQGTPQQKTLTFSVQCATKDQLKAMAPPTAPQVLVESVQLKQLLENAIAKENTWKTQLAAVKPETWTTDTLSKSVAALKTQVAQLLADENAFKTQLESLIKTTGRTDIMPERAKQFEDLNKGIQETLNRLNAPTIDPVNITFGLLITNNAIGKLINDKTTALTKLAAPAVAAVAGTECKSVGGECKDICPDEDYGPLDCPEGQRCCETTTAAPTLGVPTAADLDAMPNTKVLIITQTETNAQYKYVKQDDTWKYVGFAASGSTTFQPVAAGMQTNFTSQGLLTVYSKDKWGFVT